jgi:hypothetical protein
MESRTRKTGKAFDRFDKVLKRVGINLAALAGALSVGALTNAAKNAIDYADSMAKVADKVGVTVEELQGLRFAADQAGVASKTLDMALQRFARRMGEAAKGTGELYKTATALGIEFKNADGSFQSTTQLLFQYADAIGEATTQQEALRLTFKAFDSEGAALVTLFQNGAEGLREYLAVVDEFNLAISEDTARSAEQINNRIGVLDRQFKTFTTETLVAASEAVLEFFGIFSDESRARAELERLEAQLAKVQAIIADPDTNDGFRKKLVEQAVPDLERQIASLNDELRILEAIDVENSMASVTTATEEATKKFGKLKEEIALFEDPLKIYKDQIDLVTEAVVAGAISYEQGAAAIARIAEEAYYATEPLGIFEKQVSDLMEEFQAFDGDRLAALYAALKRFEDLGDTASADNVWDAIVSEEGFNDAEEKLKTIGTVGEESLKKIADAMDGFARDFTNELVDGLAEGELAFDDFAKSVLKTIAKIVLNEIFTQFFTAISGSLFGANTASVDPTSLSLPSPEPNASVERAGSMTPSMIVGRASLAGSDTKPKVVVNVNNYGDDEVTVTERQDSNGGLEIDVLIKNTVKAGFAAGDFDKVMSSSYGARRLAY